jgi:hypothetical protein
MSQVKLLAGLLSKPAAGSLLLGRRCFWRRGWIGATRFET